MYFQVTGAACCGTAEDGKPQLFRGVLGSDQCTPHGWSQEHPKTCEPKAGFTQHHCSERGSRSSAFPCRCP